jgi:hypothetical protein
MTATSGICYWLLFFVCKRKIFTTADQKQINLIEEVVDDKSNSKSVEKIIVDKGNDSSFVSSVPIGNSSSGKEVLLKPEKLKH